MSVDTITIKKSEYEKLRNKAQLSESLLVKLVQGLEDIKAGRIKPWRKNS
ncbi:hypothetical protein HYX18_04795 [Candidatus Woesearchaeota archaeon]|nr:hypothetical protein [Candidatus Woesearchaeota archaeon]